MEYLAFQRVTYQDLEDIDSRLDRKVKIAYYEDGDHLLIVEIDAISLKHEHITGIFRRRGEIYYRIVGHGT